MAGILLVAAGAYGVVVITDASSASQKGAGALLDGASPGAAPDAAASGSSRCPVAGSAVNCPAVPPIAPAGGKKWRLSFSEEFNGRDYDHHKLTPCFDWNNGDCTSTFNNGREHYMPSQVKVSDGTAKLIAAPLSPAYASSACQNGSCTYKAGLLSTARPNAADGSGYLYKFTYGYVESRFKFPATRGFFTAFWMLPADPTYNYKFETDIVEIKGDDPTTMYMHYHYNNRSSYFRVNKGASSNGACATKDYSKDFVRMGLDWQPDHVAWYIDGIKCGEFTDKALIANVPMQLILHMMVDNTWQRTTNVGLQDPTLVRQLEVDYIRVYQQVPR